MGLLVKSWQLSYLPGVVHRREFNVRFTPPHILTALRVFAGPLILAFLLAPAPEWASLVFALAVATDLIDGRLARARGEATIGGTFFDHAADAWFVTFGLAAYAARLPLTPLLPLGIALSFLEYGSPYLRRREPVRGSSLGRFNGVAYYALLGTLLGAEVLAWGAFARGVAQFVGFGLLATTVLSVLLRRRPGRFF